MTQAPRIAGRYAVARELGQGAFGKVLLALDAQAQDAPRALKVVSREAEERVRWELQLLCRIAHPNVARVHELLRLSQALPAFGLEAGQLLLVSDLAQGAPADQVARALGDDHEARLALAWVVLERVARALCAVHAQTLVHGDVKPDNIIVCDDRSDATLIDLGLSRAPGFEASVSGTPAFMAPELFAGELTPAADLYALGVSVWRLLAPQPAADAEPLPEQWLSHALRDPRVHEPLPAWVPVPMSRLLVSLRAADPSARPASARALVTRIGELLRDPLLAPAASRAAFGQDEAQQRSDLERALAATSLPLVGHEQALAQLSQWLAAPGLLQVVGPAGSGRSRVLRQALFAATERAAREGSLLPSYHRVATLPAELPAGPHVLHVEYADAVDPAAALRLLRSAEVMGQRCTLVLERAAVSSDAGQAVVLGVLSDLEVERLLGLALPEASVKAPLVREALAASGGLSGVLCRLLARGLSQGDDMSRAGSLRAHAVAGHGPELARLPPPLRPLAQLLALCGGKLSQALAQACLEDAPALAQRAHELAALGLCTHAAHGELELREDWLLPLVSQLPEAAARTLALRVPDALLDARGSAWVACARGEHARARDLWLAEAQAASRRGDPAEAVRLAREALARLGSGPAELELRLALADALRALGRYPEAASVLEADVAESAQLARAELARLQADASTAAQLAQPLALAGDPVRSQPLAQLLLARLHLDAAEPLAARAGAQAWLGEGATPEINVRAAEIVALAELALGRHGAARTALDAGLQLAAGRNDRAAEARLRSVLACVLRAQGDLRGAGREFARACALAVRSGEAHAAASFLVNLGTAQLDAGELGPALQTLRQGAQRFSRLGRSRDLSRALYNFALAAQLSGDEDVALGAARHAEQAARESGDAAALAFVQVLIAEISLERGDQAAAQAALGALADFSQLGVHEREVICSRASTVCVGLGQLPRALACLDACRGAAGEPAVDSAGVSVEHALAQSVIEAARGEVRGALQAAERAASQARTLGEMPLQVLTLRQAARCAELASDAALSRLRYAELRTLLDAAALTLPPAERARLREVPAYRAALSAVPLLREPASSETDPRWRRLSALSKQLTAERRVIRLYEIIVDAAIDLSGAQSGFLLLHDAQGELQLRMTRGAAPGGTTGVPNGLSHSIAARVAHTGQPLSTVDAVSDARLDAATSVHKLALRSVLALPLRMHGSVVGVLYLDDRLRPFAFGDAEIALLSDLADLAAIALDGAERLRRERRALRRLRVAQERLARRVEAQAAQLAARAPSSEGSGVAGIVAESPAMRSALSLSLRVARAEVPVLIRGESGTGKELVARAIHDGSARKDHAFVSENCGAIPETLLESALFGHVRGAFTGADKRRSGLFEIADGGTLFLDEIGEMSPAMQARLLRVLQNGELRPIGSERVLHVDVRVLAATHRDLEAMVHDGSFREDLFYRLSVVQVALPALRERVEDVPALAAHFIEKHAAGRNVRIERRALDVLCTQSWPGNVRQLENEIRRALVLAGDVIGEEHFSVQQTRAARTAASELDMRSQIDALERRLIRRAMASVAGNQTKAAQLLGVSRFGLQKMLKRLEIDADA